MVGNDVVDINFASKQSNWRRAGLLKKVFTGAEQDRILNSGNPDVLAWLFWSMKESAYKINVQQFRKRFFAPLRFECFYERISEYDFKGRVNYDSCSYVTVSEISNNIIYTVAFPDVFTPTFTSWEGGFGNGLNIVYEKVTFSNSLYHTQHNTIYSSLLNKVSRLTKNSYDKLIIKKDPFGIPKIFCSGQTVDLSLSISHHGLYGAYVVSLVPGGTLSLESKRGHNYFRESLPL